MKSGEIIIEAGLLTKEKLRQAIIDNVGFKKSIAYKDLKFSND